MSRIHRKVPPARQQDRDRLLRRARHALRGRLAGAQGPRRLRLHRRPGAARRGDAVGHPARRPAARREGGAPGRLPRRARARGVHRDPVRRLPPRRRRAASTSTPRRSAAPSPTTAIVRAMKADGVERLQRRQHAQGQRHPALLSLRRPDQPGADDLQAVARSGVRRRVRRPHGDERVPERHQACRTGWASRRRTAPTPTAWAPRTRRRTSSSSTRGCASSTRSWASPSGSRRCAIEPEEVTVAFEQGLAGQPQRQALRVALRAVPGVQRRRRPPRPRHERPDREPRHRRQEPRHLRGARRWRCCTSATSACCRRSTTRTRPTSTS